MPLSGGAVNAEFAIDISHLHKMVAVGFWGRKRVLLEDLSLHIPTGAVYGFVGPNGAGKSTTIKHIIGGARPTRGTVRVFGGDPIAAPTRARLGYLPEQPQLPGTLTPDDVLRLHAHLCGLKDPGKRIDELLQLLELKERRSDRIGSFSKGMQQRVGLALALVHAPEVLVLDEPMSGLDPLGRELVRNLIRAEARRGCTVFFSTHVLSDVQALCDHVAVLDRGKLVHEGPVESALQGTNLGHRIGFACAGALPPVVRALGEVESERGFHTLTVAVGHDVVAAAVHLRDAGCRVESMEPIRATLEDRILALLQRGP
jgi:ABC-2 type transport system ATP-binding protein